MDARGARRSEKGEEANVSDQKPSSADSASVTPSYAFLNIPYDDRFEELFLAYIAGISAYDLVPRATLEIPRRSRRLDRIFELIRSCRSSFHDLSRVELDLRRPPTPRFINMPFELGMVVAWDKLHPGEHVWFVFEAKERRLLKSLSDLAGTDAYVHGGRPKGLFRELSNALVRSEHPPTVEEMARVHHDLKAALPAIRKRAAARSSFEARVFTELLVTPRAVSAEMRRAGGS
jgi:hypothetical protein